MTCRRKWWLKATCTPLFVNYVTLCCWNNSQMAVFMILDKQIKMLHVNQQASNQRKKCIGLKIFFSTFLTMNSIHIWLGHSMGRRLVRHYRRHYERNLGGHYWRHLGCLLRCHLRRHLWRQEHFLFTYNCKLFLWDSWIIVRY